MTFKKVKTDSRTKILRSRIKYYQDKLIRLSMGMLFAGSLLTMAGAYMDPNYRFNDYLTGFIYGSLMMISLTWFIRNRKRRSKKGSGLIIAFKK